MSSVEGLPVIQYFADISGKSLDDGFVYIGTSGLDPVANPISVFWDAALTIPAPNPIRTRNGHPDRSGVPARFFVDTDSYSFAVKNKNGTTVYTALDSLSASDLERRLRNNTDSTKGSGIVGFKQNATGAVGSTLQSKVSKFVSVADFGAVGDGVTDDTAEIEAADEYAFSIGAELHFEQGRTYQASELFIKTRVVRGNFSTIKKNATTAQGFFNWGNKPSGIIDGYIENLTLDAATADNVVNLRIYGDHTRPKLRNLVLLNSDFYAIGVGALTTPGDKLDVVNGLDIDGIYIASTRGNSTLGTDHSLGLELFPGVNCSDWKIRNVTTRGKIINKVHSVDGLFLDELDFVATSVFDPLGSGYCEINNCNNVFMGQNIRTFAGSLTHYSLSVGGYRVVGGMPVNDFRLSGRHQRVQVREVASLISDSGFKATQLDLNGPLPLLDFVGSTIDDTFIATSVATTIGTLKYTGTTLKRLRLNDPSSSVADFTMSGGVLTCDSSNSRFQNVVGRLDNVSIMLRGTPQSFAIQSDGAGTSITLSHCMIDGNTDWDRPLFISNSGSMKAVKNNLDRLVTNTLTASGSAALTYNVDNTVNGV